MSAKKRK